MYLEAKPQSGSPSENSPLGMAHDGLAASRRLPSPHGCIYGTVICNH